MAIIGSIKARVREELVYWYTLSCTALAPIFGDAWDEFLIKRKYKRVFGHKPDLENPRTLNEKLQWLKLHERKDLHTICADKLAVREYWKQFGEQGLVPLLFSTRDWRQITAKNIPDVPCIVKCNTGSGGNEIIRNKSKVDFRRLQRRCRHWMAGNYYYRSQEWQYKNIEPCILVEQLLLDRSGHIPNDYKLHYINGVLQFVYCTVDRERKNYRVIYSPDWQRMDMEWLPKKDHGKKAGADIPCPSTFQEMKRIADVIAQNFKYVRVDFYDVDGKLYYGEITMHHGSGYDTFEPEKYDAIYGEKLVL